MANNPANHSLYLAGSERPAHPATLWMKQSIRKLRAEAMLQDEILAVVVEKLKEDQNLLGILLFGSLATRTHTWKSDIDLIFIYETYEPDSGLVNRYINGIEVQYFFTTLDTLIINQKNVPYLLHMFAEAEILFDRTGSVAPVVNQLKAYFQEHPEVEEDWTRLKSLHQVEKKGPICAQTTIIHRWEELEDKYSGGERKRTFFRL